MGKIIGDTWVAFEGLFLAKEGRCSGIVSRSEGIHGD